MPITQKEIAVRLGVSTSLVSRALSGQGGLIGAKEDTVRRIRDEAERLGYRPDTAALMLRGRTTRTLGVIVRDFADPFVAHLVRGMQRQARAQGVSLLLAGGEGWAEIAKDLDHLLRYRPDGLVFCGSDLDGVPDDLARLAGLPAAQIGGGPPLPGVFQVRADEGPGLRELLDHLWALGHRSVGFLGNTSAAHRRRADLLAALLAERPDAPLNLLRCRVLSDDPAAAFAALGAGLPGAIVAGDDEVALVLLRRAHEAGLRVPADLSLAGCDDIPAARLAIPALSTIRFPLEDMAERALAWLCAPHGAGAPAGSTHPTRFVARETCAPPPASYPSPRTRSLS